MKKDKKISKLGFFHAAACVVTAVGFQSSPVFEPVREYTETHLNFRARSALGFPNSLHPKLKIIGFDDRTFEAWRRRDIGLESLVAVLDAISVQNPKAVLIDKIFRYPESQPGSGPISASQGQRYVNLLNQLSMRIVSAAYVGPVVGSSPMASTDPRGSSPTSSIDTIDRLDWLKTDDGVIHGADSSIRDAFHLGYLERASMAKVDPAIRVGNTIIFYGGLLPLGQPELDESGLLLNNQRVYLDGEGRLPVNFVDPKSMSQNAISMLKVLEDVIAGRPLTYIQKDDIVVYVPDFFTGSTDFKDTPVGRYPGAIYPISVLNSGLHDTYIQPKLESIGATFVWCLGAIILAWFAAPKVFWIVTALMTTMTVFSGIYLFSAHQIQVPWLFHGLCFGCSGIILFAYRAIRTEQRAQILQTALEGTFPPQRLQEILDNPSILDRTPEKIYLTIMFVDIAGFSVTIKDKDPESAFDELKSHLNAIMGVVHKFGGFIDRTMGDGLLCFFGYDPAGKSGQQDHAEQAMACAKQIQFESLLRNKERFQRGFNIYPLRIGINSAHVFIGDVGDERRIDYTIIGDGVNYASRLETACAPHMIMISSETKRGIRYEIKDNECHLRHIQVKHFSTLFEAYEIDSHDAHRDLYRGVNDDYRKLRNLGRRDARYECAENQLMLATEFGDFPLREMSIGGFSALLPIYLARRVTINAHITSNHPKIKEDAQGIGFIPFAVEVKWGTPFGRSYLHGFQIKGLVLEQRKKLMQICAPALNPIEQKAG